MASLFSGSGLFGGSSTGLFGGAFEQRRRIASSYAQMDPEERERYLARLQGIELAEPPEKQSSGFWDRFVPDIVELGASQIADALVQSIPGMVEMGRAVVNDVRDVGAGDLDFERTRELGRLTAEQIEQDFRNPTENPGYLLLDLLGIGSLGAGTAARGLAARRTFGQGMAARRGEAPGAPPGPPPLGTPPRPPQPSGPPRTPQEMADKYGSTMAPWVRDMLREKGATFPDDAPPTTLTRAPEEAPPLPPAEAAALPPTVAERVARAREQEAALPQQAVLRKQGKGWASEELPGGVRVGVRPSPERPGAWRAFAVRAGSLPEDVGPIFTIEREAVRYARDMGQNVILGLPKEQWDPLSGVGAASLKRDLGAIEDAEAQKLMAAEPGGESVFDPQGPKFGLGALPEHRAAAAELQTLWRSGMRPSTPEFRQAHRQILVRHLGDEEGKRAYAEYYRISGGQDVSMRQVIGDTLRTFARRPEPGVREIKMFVPEEFGEELGTVAGKQVSGTWRRAQVPLSRNPMIRAFQNAQLDYMEKNPDKRAGLFHARLAERIAFHEDEIGRMTREAEDTLAGLEKAAEEVRAGKKTWKDVVDTMNMAAKVGALFLKPAYVPANVLGQIALTMTHHSWNPVRLAKSAQIQNDLFRNEVLGERYARAIRQAMEEGLVKSYAYEQGVSRRFAQGYHMAQRGFNWILDTPFRDNAFISEAMRHGFTDAEKIGRLLQRVEAGDARAVSKFREIAQRANRSIIDYGRLGPQEKALIRRIIFFYPWFKGASIYGSRFMAEHAVQGQAVVQSGRIAGERAEGELGPVPSYLEGAFKFGEREISGLGKVPTIINPEAITVLGTPGEVIEAARSFIAGNRREAGQLSEFLSPAVSGGIAAATGVDPFTGATIPAEKGAPQVFAETLASSVAPLRLAENLKRARQFESGERDPTEVLHPYSTGEAIGRFFGPGFADLLNAIPGVDVSPLGSYALNPREARSRAFAESRSLEDKRQREILKHRDYRDQFAQAGRQTGVFSELPEDLSQAFALRGQKEAEIAALGEQLDRDLTQLDRLQAELQVLVRRGIYNEDSARQLLEQMASVGDEGTIRSLRRRLSGAYFGGDLISAYKATLNASGAQLTVP